ncbi:hypothetical protein B0J17DRAFT_707528 [Rhizoctonia solani]|nr:hypothetical protein B0J17DRAFT_707528 [Rhizoctonia solani]
MTTQKRKVGAGDYDPDIEILSDSDSTLASVKIVNHTQIVPTKKARPSGPPKISHRMQPKYPSAMDSTYNFDAGSKATETGRGGNIGPSISRQRTLDVHAELKEVHRKLDILLAWVGKLKRGATSQLEKEPPEPTPPKTIRRAATFSDFHHN